MNGRTITTAIGIMSVVFAMPALASEPPELKNNPFSRPPSERTASFSREDDATEGSSPTPELQATMVASQSRLANVDGRIVRPGDEVQGYTLLHVHDDHAIFVRNGKRLTVYVKPDLVEDDE